MEYCDEYSVSPDIAKIYQEIADIRLQLDKIHAILIVRAEEDRERLLGHNID